MHLDKIQSQGFAGQMDWVYHLLPTSRGLVILCTAEKLTNHVSNIKRNALLSDFQDNTIAI
jgi:hypothetical protein